VITAERRNKKSREKRGIPEGSKKTSFVSSLQQQNRIEEITPLFRNTGIPRDLAGGRSETEQGYHPKTRQTVWLGSMQRLMIQTGASFKRNGRGEKSQKRNGGTPSKGPRISYQGDPTTNTAAYTSTLVPHQSGEKKSSAGGPQVFSPRKTQEIVSFAVARKRKKQGGLEAGEYL